MSIVFENRRSCVYSAECVVSAVFSISSIGVANEFSSDMILLEFIYRLRVSSIILSMCSEFCKLDAGTLVCIGQCVY